MSTYNENSTYAEWMRKVRGLVAEKCPYPLSELPENPLWNYAQTYEDGGSAEDMASDILYDLRLLDDEEDV